MACRSLTPPGSYSIVVTPTVEPTANTTATPVSTSERRTIDRRPSVRSTIAPSPGVLSRSSPPCTAIASGPHPNPPELALADLQHGAIEALGGDVEVVGAERLAVELDPALGEHPPGIRAREPEPLRQQSGHVDLAVARAHRQLGHLLGRLVAHEQAVEVLLGTARRVRPRK